MFTFYADVSGHPDDTSVLCAAGMVATADQWKRIEKQWQTVLDRNGVLELHMKNFAHSTGEYASWKGDEEKRRSFLSSLIDILMPRVLYSAACSIDLIEYRKILGESGEMDLRQHISPLALAGCSVINAVRRWGKYQGKNLNYFRYIFEDGDADRGNFSDISHFEFGFRPSFEPKEASIAFQAADLLAYEHQKVTNRLFMDSGVVLELEKLRKPFQKLRNIPHSAKDENGSVRDSWLMMEGPQLRSGFSELSRLIDLAKPRQK